MTQVILQPCGSKDSRQHYEDTIDRPVELSLIEEFLDGSIVEALHSANSERKVATWGVTAGKSGQQVKKWERLDAGDIALFSRDGRIVSSATVILKAHSKELAERLWGHDKSGQTWEYIYFLGEISALAISYADFNAVAGYAENFVIQGFNVLNPERSLAIVEQFDLASDTIFPEIPESDFVAAVSFPEGPLDVASTARTRTEQGFLRRFLFKNNREYRCCFCGDQLPVEFLVAAHIKRRADCTDEEKVDYQNVVMPMCRLGCDELYERGYIGVKFGKIVRLKREKTGNDRINALIKSLEGRKCAAWTSESSKYFDAHMQRIERMMA